MKKEFDEQEKTGFYANYTKDKKLGEGMHASVYRCFKMEDVLKEFPFAVKISREDDEEKRQASFSEFEMTSKLDHKNVVRSFEVFDNSLKGEIYQVMQYVEGIEVLDQIAQQPDGWYTEENARELFKQIMEGIEYLHG